MRLRTLEGPCENDLRVNRLENTLKKFALFRGGKRNATQHPSELGEALLRLHALGRRHAFAFGAGSVFDLGGTSARRPKLGGMMDDVRALEEDVRLLQKDLDVVLERHRKKLEQHVDAQSK